MASKKRNALKHGANTKEVMLWNERYEDYEALRAELCLEFSPSGSTEEYLVQTLLDLRWRRRRLDCHEQITIQKRLDRNRENNVTGRFLERVGALASELKGADSVEKVEAILSRLDPYRETVLKVWPFPEGADPKVWGSNIAESVARWRPASRREGADEFVEVFDLKTFDDDLARIERLDAMIDRTIKRLMQVKTMKQMHDRLEPKLIDLPATRNPPAQEGDREPLN